MIDRLNSYAGCLCLLLTLAVVAPSLPNELNSTSSVSYAVTSEKSISSGIESLQNSLQKEGTVAVKTLMNNEPIQSLTTPMPLVGRLQATQEILMKSRRNKNSLLFSGHNTKPELVTEKSRRSKQREINTKPPIKKRTKTPESLEPHFERRPALLLRFFPDGTAVLISKFQLHLHVKPKQINFDSEEDIKVEDPLDYDPGVFLNEENGFEVAYKGLEAITSSREENLDDPEEDPKMDSVQFSDKEEEVDHSDHEHITPFVSSTDSTELKSNGKPFPLMESSNDTDIGNVSEINNTNNTESFDNFKVNRDMVIPAGEGSPFFVMTSDEMSALQHQYDPIQASPLTGTVSPQFEKQQETTLEEQTFTTSTTTTTHAIPTTPVHTLPEETTETTTSETTQEATTTTPTKCLSFRNQLSLVLSTEDNIDNSLLKKHILPTEDCNTSGDEKHNEFENLKSVEETTTKELTKTTAPTTSTVPTTTTPQTEKGNNLVPYLSSRLASHSSGPDVVVVTSLPVLIDLKNSRNKHVTDAPAWREVTVGVVRDQQGQPLKPRYNNWTAHLRTIKKKPGFWNELTTPKPATDFNNHKHLPTQQGFQHSPSHIHNAYWTDLQRQRPIVSQQPRNRNIHSQQYLANPPQNYHVPKVNDFQWRNPSNYPINQWNSNRRNDFISPHDVLRTKPPMEQQNKFENYESQHLSQWNNRNQRRPSSRRS